VGSCVNHTQELEEADDTTKSQDQTTRRSKMAAMRTSSLGRFCKNVLSQASVKCMPVRCSSYFPIDDKLYNLTEEQKQVHCRYFIIKHALKRCALGLEFELKSCSQVVKIGTFFIYELNQLVIYDGLRLYNYSKHFFSAA
jgi:hypothetical protein